MGILKNLPTLPHASTVAIWLPAIGDLVFCLIRRDLAGVIKATALLALLIYLQRSRRMR